MGMGWRWEEEETESVHPESDRQESWRLQVAW